MAGPEKQLTTDSEYYSSISPHGIDLARMKPSPFGKTQQEDGYHIDRPFLASRPVAPTHFSRPMVPDLFAPRYEPSQDGSCATTGQSSQEHTPREHTPSQERAPPAPPQLRYQKSYLNAPLDNIDPRLQ